VDKTSVNDAGGHPETNFSDSKTSFGEAKSSFGMSDEKPKVLLEMAEVSFGICMCVRQSR
jgi:hypothetical protein